ncbi:DNA helicase/exodeoxyribonuclease V, subunit A [Evansella caseinilytica]|uniref:ATP-dependent helicase/nuclease subunit A n=1 Tax=Evansella caseinilytica TaxID=1503961 RepID=A0A1H3NPG1_9BACI|nr:helicase-exonuclease AddAB subunit AddA [Evansella caseinilytica]SDY90714.1 DNA helicase/exodeoxyribonuclease V, subunit A [Evansella caseinilytica]
MEIQPKPEGATWTDDQWKAIDAAGNNILVAAAAGSGKTAVLVERIIRKIVSADNPVDVDRLLIVTFTNAAAAEMKNRIGEAIEKELKNNPSSLHLRRQLLLLNRANISTLHAFCMKVIRQYYYEVQVDPNFRILDDTEGELIREEIVDELFEEEYGKENNQAFFDVVDKYSGDRSDDALRTLLRRLYDFSRSHPAPALWLDSIADTYDISDAEKLEQLPWTADLLRDVRLQLAGALSWLEKALAATKEPGGPAKYGENLDEDIDYVRRLTEANEWKELYQAFQTGGFGRLKTISKKEPVDEGLKERVKSLREQAKKQVETIRTELFNKEPELFLEEVKEMAPTVSTIVRLVNEFSSRYWSAKLEKAAVDFNDLEHLCLTILGSMDGTTKQWGPSRAAKEFQEHFAEVLVDEYQDTNLVQETILSLLTKGNNRFMVGDVKQSIYRFRLAEPSLFLTKYKTYRKAGEGAGWRIDLAKNFRSRSEILDATNFIFRQIMDEAVGEIVYDTDAELKLGNLDYPEQEEMEAVVAVINKGTPLQIQEPGDEQTGLEEDLETSQLEARYLIQEIKKLINAKHPVYDKKLKVLRPITYRDIVILMRSMPWAATIMDECKQEGIPVYADLSTGYFEAVEIQVMMSLLKAIDNPYQDIPIAAVLRSPLYRFDEQQLAHIRIMDRHGSYYEALKTTAEASPDEQIREKVKDFLRKLAKWRTKARSGALSELIWELYRETGYFDYVGGLSGGKQRQANLRAFYDRARAYESTSFRGLFRFLRFVERMQERGDDLGTARALGEQEDVVRIMTIHKSKGLEFPVVFVAGANKRFNTQDLYGSYLLHKDLGFGSKYIDPKLRVAYPSLPQLAIKKRMQLEALAEEMRVLYVALTRAKEKIYLVGTVNEADKTLEKWQEFRSEPQWLLPAVDRQKGTSYFDWIGPAVFRHRSSEWLGENGTSFRFAAVKNDPSKWKLQIVERETLQEEEKAAQVKEEELELCIRELRPVPISSDKQQAVKQRLEWVYPFMDATVHRSKQTVSELKREMTDEYSEKLFHAGFHSASADRPKFLQETSLTAAEQGTILHTVMQHVALTDAPTKESILRKIDLMVENELLLKEQAEAVDTDSIVRFFSSNLGERLLKARWVEREVPFSLAVAASTAYASWGQAEEETALVQGVIDCVFADETGRIVLLDYKTDAIAGRFPGGFEEAKSVMKERYEIQLQLYLQALETIWKQPVQEAHLYFFDGGHVLTMKDGE